METKDNQYDFEFPASFKMNNFEWSSSQKQNQYQYAQTM